MLQYLGSRSASEAEGRENEELPARPVAPGKRTRTQRLRPRVDRAGTRGVVARRGDGPIREGAAEALARARASAGQPLPDELRRRFEAALGADLASVRVHVDSDAAAAAALLGAHAFAHGQDIFFAAGRYQPGSRDGERLIAHEVAHTAQQAHGDRSTPQLAVTEPGDALEREADALAEAMTTTPQAREAPAVSAAPASVQRYVPPSGSMEQDYWDHRVAALRNAPDLAQLRARWSALVSEIAGLRDDEAARARAAGQAAGDRLWQLAHERMQRTEHNPADTERGFDAHFDPLHQMIAEAQAARPAGGAGDLVHALGGGPIAAAVDAFEQAARGMSSIDWTRSGDGRVRHVLITGFDPFDGGDQPPTRANWNPSGAAAMRLDGTEITEGGQRIAIEGVVYPVSFEEFDRGIVERVVSGQAGSVDAIITVSLDRSIGTDAGHNNPVRIEQFSVGMHNRTTISPHATRREVAHPAGEERVGRAGAGPEAVPAIAAPVDADAISQDQGGHAVVGSDMHVRFRPEDISRAMTHLGAEDDGEGPNILHITECDVAAAIAQGHYVAAPGSRDTHMEFTARGQTFTAEIVNGPGGNFLSNEVAFRTQRQLAASGSSATSFHVHTPGEDANLDELVDTLRSIVRSVIRHRPAQPTPSPP